jgi:2,4-dienoyl-CoA reductase-like NADH-dependent reductase (Old Yellow Enzyme family)
MNHPFTPVRVGRYTLPNRLVMASMTRSRAKPFRDVLAGALKPPSA